MLLRTLFVVALFTALAETVVHGMHALAQAALRREALVALRAEIADATTLAHDAAVRAVIAGGDPRTLEPQPPPPMAACRLRLRGACALMGKAVVRFAPVPSASPSPCPQFECATYQQGNDAVAEGRIEAIISAEALAPLGAVLASRVQTIVFRTLRVAPYAALAGQADASEIAGGSSGDDAGTAPAGAAPGTLVDVLYRNAVTGATIPANVWQATATSPNRATPWKP